MDEEQYVQGVERMRMVASEKKAIVALYADDKSVAHKLHKGVCTEEKNELKLWVKEYDELALSLGAALHELRNSPDGEPIEEGVSLNTNYNFDVEDESKIPKMFWKLDESKVKKALALGGDVPGINKCVFYKLSVKTEG